ncbi:bifunctional histidinol-phosphatase/imidazoleglycerol-phosphate dehydratase HisB [Buchnera aphidicola]|uniref:bifunctional histidinol-phosphatase/imidazoleglycerol-phosphate dehydratase HisB n=1 Tax=Buchnera aphidicola TaxID=9 RepID=UPI0034647094
MPEKVLFIDRDGTLISEPETNYQIDSIEKIILEPKVISALLSLKKYSYRFVMITNQDGLGTDNFPYSSFEKPHKFMLEIFKSQGITFDNILICPHNVHDRCCCRKPKIEMVKPWLNDNSLKKEVSYVIGDRQTDIELADNMGIKGILYNRNNFNWSKIAKKIISNNRFAKVFRKTRETEIHVEVWLDKKNKSNIDTGLMFFNHMLEQISVHSGISMNILAKGDICIDDHHTIEDTGICLGQSLLKALGNKIGINRYGFSLPMDESVATCILDISGRPYLNFQAQFKNQSVGDMTTDMVEHFFYSLSYAMKSTVHIRSSGNNDHHQIESIFKVFGRVLKEAIRIEGNKIFSSKGIL